MKRKSLFLLSFILVMVLSLSILNAETTNQEYAERLSKIGVFVGTGSGFDLDREPTRLEGLIMLIRLLGVEEEAKLLSDQETKFTDVPAWGKGYVVYAYNNGLTNGLSETEFGSFKNMDAKSYMTFLLRALGYDDKAGDFSWSEAIDFALETGLIDENEYFQMNTNTFLRGDVAWTSYAALQTNVKETDAQLIDSLVDKGAIDETVASEMFAVEETVEPLVDEEIDLVALADSCVLIEVYNSEGLFATGSGFYISSDGKIVTNYHVIDGATQIVINNNDGSIYNQEVKVLGYSIEEDIAILKTNVTNSQPVTLGDSDTIKWAEKVYAIGSPKGLVNTISEGIISAIRETDIQISAPISSGSSGGALFNENGEVIGVTYAGIVEGENLGFVIPINKVKAIDTSQSYTLTELFNLPTVNETLVCYAFNDGTETHLQWNDIGVQNYYVYMAMNGSEFEIIENSSTGTYVFPYIDGISSVYFSDLENTSVYDFKVVGIREGGTIYESAPVTIIGPNTTYNPAVAVQEMIEYLNDEVPTITLGGYEIPISHFAGELSDDRSLAYVYIYVDANGFGKILDYELLSREATYNDAENLLVAFVEYLGMRVKLTLVYSDMYVDYPAGFVDNELYYNTVSLASNGKWHVFWPVFWIDGHQHGLMGSQYWYEATIQ